MKIAATIREVPPPVRPRVLVPTMGALHRGHIELIRAARDYAGADGEVAVSIFVNPLQFEPGSDLDRYPRPEQEDENRCRQAGVDLLFRPFSADEMYASDRSVFVEETSLAPRLEGRSRPGHFRGVCTVVAKLFHILNPAAAVFGEKDFQQLAIVRRMVRDLNFQIEIVGMPTVREYDGLACSSRNRYLDQAQRSQAGIIHQALTHGAQLVRAGETCAAGVVKAVIAMIETASLARIDYVELVDSETFDRIDSARPAAVLLAAVYFGSTRLIDNMRLP
jgi:pantoate--beta-alanine ligase